MTERSFGGDEQDMSDLERDALAERQRTLEETIKRNRQRKAAELDPTEFSLALGNLGVAEYEPTMAWHHDPITPSQRKLLTRAKIDLESVQDKGHASKLIGLLMPRWEQKLATPKQMMLLRKLGYRNANKATFDEANNYLTRRFGKGGK